MKYNRLTLSILIILVFSFLQSTAQTDPLANVVVYKEGMSLPSSAKKIGNVKVGDGFRFNCGYDVTLNAVKQKAIEIGGNAIKLTSVKSPDLMSTCYRMKADVYTIAKGDIPVTVLNEKKFEDSITHSLISDTASYALLYVYRPKSSLGVFVQYNLHADDSFLCRVKYDDKYIVKLRKAGNTRLWARTEARDELNLNVKPGKVYFLRCSLAMGIAVGRPVMELVNLNQGLSEFNKTDGHPERKDHDDDVYKNEDK
jgi:hypothetical protein